ncbi:MAG: InlB B-repeat-containing protein [Cuniculiplasma sp.]
MTLVTNLNSDNISILNKATYMVTDNVNVGSHPMGGVFDGSNGLTYIMNQGSGNISVVSPLGQRATFIEEGFCPGNWYVNLTGNFRSSSGPVPGNWLSGSSHTFLLSNGNYTYSIGHSNTTTYPKPATGWFLISGSNVTIHIRFYPVNETIRFTEIGLPNGTWTVSLSGGSYIIGSNSGTASYSNDILLSVTNGTYDYTVSTSNGHYHATYSSGTVRVTGYTIEYLTFVQNQYSMSFTESGLPGGYTWYVNVTGQSPESASSGSAIDLNLINGSYSYTVSTTDKEYFNSPGRGTFSIDWADHSNIQVNFSLHTDSVIFSQSTLPRGMMWYVNVTDSTGHEITNSSTTSTITFNLSNDTYTYTIASENKVFKPSPSSGNFTVSGFPVPKTINFLLVTYSIAFKETGLPSGIVWYVNVTNSTGYVFHGSSITSTITFNLINGTYTFENSTSNKIYAPSSYSGSLTVNGASLNLNTVTFSPVIYKVTFTETGLPTSSIWYVNITGHYSGAITGSTYFVMLKNGTYAYTIQTNNKIYEPSPSSGSVPVNGGAKSVSVAFSLVKYAVTFTETGLPSGTTWYVNLSNGQSFSGTGTSYSFSLINGTYSYSIASSNKLWSSSGSGFTVNGKALPETVTFSLVKYAVTFTESGIPTGTTWYVNITGQTSSGPIAGTLYSIYLSNGSYSYSVQTSNKIYEPSYINSFTVNGPTASRSITFSLVKYAVTFTETGLPTGTSWSVTLNGATETSTGSSITFTETNGTYSYTVSTPISGLTGVRYVTVGSGSVPVKGNNPVVPVPYTTQYYLAISSSPSVGGVTSPLSGWYNAGSTVTISETVNSSYTFMSWTSIGTGSYTGTSASHTITIRSPITEIASFDKLYLITFTESGIPTGTTWYVNLSNGQSFSGTGTSYSFSLINGTYSYSSASSNTLWSSSGSGFTVNGKALPETVTFSLVKYAVTFTETGLPAGTTWYVNITDHDSGAITGSTYSVMLTNGTYTYTMGTNNTNYNANGSTVIINGHSKVVSTTFTASSSPSKNSHSAISGIEIYGIIGIVAAFAVAGAVLFMIRRKK